MILETAVSGVWAFLVNYVIISILDNCKYSTEGRLPPQLFLFAVVLFQCLWSFNGIFQFLVIENILIVTFLYTIYSTNARFGSKKNQQLFLCKCGKSQCDNGFWMLQLKSMQTYFSVVSIVFDFSNGNMWRSGREVRVSILRKFYV